MQMFIQDSRVDHKPELRFTREVYDNLTYLYNVWN